MLAGITQEIRVEIIINRVNLLIVTVNKASEWKKKCPQKI